MRVKLLTMWSVKWPGTAARGGECHGVSFWCCHGSLRRMEGENRAGRERIGQPMSRRWTTCSVAHELTAVVAGEFIIVAPEGDRLGPLVPKLAWHKGKAATSVAIHDDGHHANL
eukprot:SAG11_NODE_20477_length_444_cov_1.153623_1_plen_113_part_01